jgi:hypothetical protein
MTEKGEWRFLRPGEAIVQPPGVGGTAGARPGRPRPSPRTGAGSGRSFGPFNGVASTSSEKSLRVFNGRTRYDQWQFQVGVPRIVGKDIHTRAPGLPGGVRRQRDNPQPRR